MARTSTKHFKRVTFSFPAQVLEELRKNDQISNQSQYVAEAVADKLREDREKSNFDVFSWFKEFRKTSDVKDSMNSDELIRQGREERTEQILRAARGS